MHVGAESSSSAAILEGYLPSKPPSILVAMHNKRIAQRLQRFCAAQQRWNGLCPKSLNQRVFTDRKSTRLNSQSLMRISYAVFCLKKKNKNKIKHTERHLYR